MNTNNGTLNCYSHKRSAEFNFFLVLFSLQSESLVKNSEYKVDSSMFADLMKELAEKQRHYLEVELIKDAIEREIQASNEDMDMVDELFNKPEFKWHVLNPRFTNYSVTLKFVPDMIDEMTLDNPKIKESELFRLRYFAQNVIDYRISNLSDLSQDHIIDIWKRIRDNLNEKLSGYYRLKISPAVDLYHERNHIGYSELFLN